MYYLREFKVGGDYEAYASSGEFLTPNISYIEESNETKYSPLVLTKYFLSRNESDYVAQVLDDLYNQGKIQSNQGISEEEYLSNSLFYVNRSGLYLNPSTPSISYESTVYDFAGVSMDDRLKQYVNHNTYFQYDSGSYYPGDDLSSGLTNNNLTQVACYHNNEWLLCSYSIAATSSEVIYNTPSELMLVIGRYYYDLRVSDDYLSLLNRI